MLRAIIVFFTLLGLSACSNPSTPSRKRETPPPTQNRDGLTRDKAIRNISSFETTGKLGFSNGKKAGNASLDWQQSNPNAYRIRLSGPLGSGSIQIAASPQQVILTEANGQKRVARTADILVKQVLGWDVPVSGLHYWLLGLSAPGKKPEQIVYDAHQRPTFIQQQGWSIHYASYQTVDNLEMPKKMTLENGSIRLKLILHSWTIH